AQRKIPRTDLVVVSIDKIPKKWHTFVGLFCNAATQKEGWGNDHTWKRRIYASSGGQPANCQLMARKPFGGGYTPSAGRHRPGGSYHDGTVSPAGTARAFPQ